MRLLLALAVIVCLVASTATLAAVRGKEAKYVGGTIAALAENTEGKIELAETAAVFIAKTGTKLAIPYDMVRSLEYGQKAGRRLGVAVAVSPVFLFSKKRKHYLTIGFEDEAGRKQGAVLELAKGIVRETLATLETKTGKQVEYESDDARKHSQGR